MSNIIIQIFLNSHLVDTEILNLILDTADICEETKDKPPFSIRQYSTLPLLSKTYYTVNSVDIFKHCMNIHTFDF